MLHKILLIAAITKLALCNQYIMNKTETQEYNTTLISHETDFETKSNYNNKVISIKSKCRIIID